MNKSIIIVPTYPPHYPFIEELIKSYEQYDINADLMFVFSNESDRLSFNNENYINVVLPDEFSHIDFHRGIIHLKKFFGLQESIKLGYNFAGVVDSETRVIKSIDANVLFENFCRDKLVYGTICDNPWITRLTVSPFKFFNEEEVVRLKEITNNGLIYFWCSNIPIYDLSIFKLFNERISLSDYCSISSDFDFDYTVFMYYALLYHDYRLEVVPKHLSISGNDGSSIIEYLGFYPSSIPENISQEVLDYIKPFWINHGTKGMRDDIFLKFNYDRQIR